MNEQLRSNLSLGKSVEQWLMPETFDTYTLLKWITIERNKDFTYSTSYTEVFDDGDENFTDIYAFSYADPDEPAVLNTFGSYDEALDFVTEAYHAALDKFVTPGMLQDEYKDYLKTRKT
jgi:hypothetical protein